MEKRYGKNTYTEKEQIERGDIHKDKTYLKKKHSRREDTYGKEPSYKDKIYTEKENMNNAQ